MRGHLSQIANCALRLAMLASLSGCGAGGNEALEAPTLDRSSDIAGPDINKNGVRDDIEAWVNLQPVNEGQRKAPDLPEK